MIHQHLDALQASSTAAHVSRFLRETQLSESMADLENSAPIAQNTPESGSNLLNMASTPQLDVHVVDSAETDPRLNNDNNAYKNMLKYMPNANFRGELSSINGASVPNTFKHKSHPNARTKARIGHVNEEILSHIDPVDPMEPVKTSTVKGLSLSSENINEEGHTPSWMPPGLDQKWEDSSANLSQHQQLSGSVKVHRGVQGDAALDFLNSESNTFVHNVPTSQQEPATTPMWKRVSQDYKNKAGKPLQSIFQSADDSKGSDSANNEHSAAKRGQSVTLFSSTSTPMAARESEVHLTQQQIHQLEDMLERAKDKPDDYQIKGSPLKLFGSEYDTFTKAILTKFVDRVRSNANSVQREPLPVPVQLAAPQMNIKNFTKLGQYSDVDFKKNANNIFANIQKRGRSNSNVFHKPSVESFHKSLSHNTATSTPKVHKTQNLGGMVSNDEYSLYSSNFDDSSSAGNLQAEKHDSTTDRHDYTSIEKTYLHQSVPDNVSQDDNGSSYTFDDLSDFDESGPVAAFASHHKTPVAPVPDESPFSEGFSVEDSMSSVRQHVSRMDRNPQADRSVQSIRWKKPSQLKLQKEPKKIMRLSSAGNIVKGTVRPGNYPEKYGDMVFDIKNNRWISENKENNNYPDSLDSIEDLLSDDMEVVSLEPKRREPSILKNDRARGSRRAKENLEVSFQVPNSSTQSADHKESFNATNVTDLHNMTFTLSNKRLISMITGSTDESAWEKITYIDLSNKNLERVEGLEDYLPNIKKLNLSSNHVEFIDGLPQGLFELNIARNNVGNITSFKKFRDLQVLEALFNSLKSLSCLSYNLHITKLELSNNNVASLQGLELMNSLMSLDLSSNQVLGHINFGRFNFPNLQILNLSDNRIQGVSGLEFVPNLRILNLNDNRLESLDCLEQHSHLKKLLVKFNRLKELNLEPFPFLRILRIDGNSLNAISSIRKLRLLQELSAKCQDSSKIAKQIVLESTDVIQLDLSGNYILANMFLEPPLLDKFANLNLLNLSAAGLSSLPLSFGEAFENVRELNINFNRLTNLEGLTKLCRLKRVNAVSNNISKMEMVLSSLRNSRKTLKLLDLRLNVFNFDFYPYVFNPHELEIAAASNIKNSESSPIPLEAYDDIENFSIHYNTLLKSREEWEERDADFFEQMRADGDYKRVNERLNYVSILVRFFPRLRDLDGSVVSVERRAELAGSIHVENSA